MNVIRSAGGYFAFDKTKGLGKPTGLKENTRLKSKTARTGKKPCLAPFNHHSTVFLQTKLYEINEP